MRLVKCSKCNTAYGDPGGPLQGYACRVCGNTSFRRVPVQQDQGQGSKAVLGGVSGAALGAVVGGPVGAAIGFLLGAVIGAKSDGGGGQP
jgi:hypothetical protein